MIEISICLGISTLCVICILMENGGERWSNTVINLATAVMSFLLIIRVNTYGHTLHYFLKYNYTSWHIPALIFIVELLTLVGSMAAKIYWEIKKDGCQPTLGFILMTVLMMISYYYLFRLWICIVVPCVFFIAVWVYMMVLRRRERRVIERRMNLPTWTYDTYVSNLEADRHPAKECWIWLEDFWSETEITLFPCANNHIFHKKWITEWMRQNNTCPIDRSEI